jgi:hypothetical protein
LKPLLNFKEPIENPIELQGALTVQVPAHAQRAAHPQHQRVLYTHGPARALRRAVAGPFEQPRGVNAGGGRAGHGVRRGNPPTPPRPPPETVSDTNSDW